SVRATAPSAMTSRAVGRRRGAARSSLRPLRQERRVEHRRVRGDDRRAALREQTRDVRAAEAAAEDERAAPRPAMSARAHSPTALGKSLAISCNRLDASRAAILYASEKVG